MGGDSFYRGQTGEVSIARHQARPGAPEVEYLPQSLSEEEMAGLYTACDCLVSPYRGEGFALPVAEAMASGLPVVVTGQGAVLDYCDVSRAFLIPSQTRFFEDCRVGSSDTVGRPWLAEPDGEALAGILRRIVTHPDEARAKGAAACAFIRNNLTWDHSATVVERRLEALRGRHLGRPAHRAMGY